MSLSTLTTLTLAALAASVAWYLGGTLGTGVVAGFLAGSSVAGLVLFAQQKVARSRPSYVLHAVMGGFLAKASAMMTLTLLVRYVPALEERCDPRTFLIAFAAAAIGILLPGTIDTLRLVDKSLSKRSAGSALASNNGTR
jgi:hypothetical protein